MMIIRLAAQWAFFFHGWRVALEIIAIGEANPRDLTANLKSSSSRQMSVATRDVALVLCAAIPCGHNAPDLSTLQWGRVHKNAKGFGSLEKAGSPLLASMGPRSFELCWVEARIEGKTADRRAAAIIQKPDRQ